MGVFHAVPVTPGSPWGDRKEGALFWWGRSQGRLLGGGVGGGVDEIPGCTGGQLPAGLSRLEKSDRHPNTLLNEAQPVLTSLPLPVFSL